MANYIKEHRRGIIGTTLFHLLIIVFFILYKGFSTPLPLPDAEGILVNFGTEEQGSGEFEPKKADVPPPVEETIEQIEEVEETVEEPETTEEITETPEEEILTQETEEAPEVNAAEKKKKEEEAEKKRIEEEKERKRQEKIAELKRVEEKRIKDSVENAKREEQKRLLQEKINKQFAKGDTESDGEGETQGDGNQGTIEGAPNADNYNGTSKGEGISWSLAGRNPQKLPKPEYIEQVEGIVVVEVFVDRHGNVIEARPGIKGSTTTDNKLMEAAKKAALNAKFDTKPDAPPRQTGTITYHFMLE